jgi:hypothetical protein
MGSGRMLPMLLRDSWAAGRFRRQFAMDFEDDTALLSPFSVPLLTRCRSCRRDAGAPRNGCVHASVADKNGNNHERLTKIVIRSLFFMPSIMTLKFLYAN